MGTRLVHSSYCELPTKVPISSKAPRRSSARAKKPASASQPSASAPQHKATAAMKQPFRFLDLPAELRNTVYQHLIVHGQVLSFVWVERTDSQRGQLWGRLYKNYMLPADTVEGRWGVNAESPDGKVAKDIKLITKDCVAILLVNKFISNEAKAVIYAQNTFRFTIDALRHVKNSLHSSLIFGPLGTPITLPLLRNLRSVSLVLELEDWGSGHWEDKRQRGRLEHFVNIMKAHGDDDRQKSLLKSLSVVATLKPRQVFNLYGVACTPKPVPVMKYMFAAESLAALSGIPDVRITGLPSWFSECLERVVKGKGGKVKEIEYPDIWVRRRVPNSGNRRKKMYLVSTKIWWQPKFDWKEFAVRNGVEVPRGLDLLRLGEDEGDGDGERVEEAMRRWMGRPRKRTMNTGMARV